VLVARNNLTLDVQHGLAADVVAVALLVAVQIGKVARDQLVLDVVPGPGAYAVAGIDARCGAFLLLAQIRAPRASRIPSAQSLGGVLANLVSAGESANIARTRRIVGNKEADATRITRGQGRRALLGLRELSSRPQKRDCDGRNNDFSVHCITSLNYRWDFIVHCPSAATVSRAAHAIWR
jgi:hypothetical protein